jgi:hypothetical protein
LSRWNKFRNKGVRKLKKTNKELIEKALFGIKRKVMLKMYTGYNVPIKTFQTAVNRGSFSKELSYHMETITTYSPLFWQDPSVFNQDGNRR